MHFLCIYEAFSCPTKYGLLRRPTRKTAYCQDTPRELLKFNTQHFSELVALNQTEGQKTLIMLQYFCQKVTANRGTDTVCTLE